MGSANSLAGWGRSVHPVLQRARPGPARRPDPPATCAPATRGASLNPCMTSRPTTSTPLLSLIETRRGATVISGTASARPPRLAALRDAFGKALRRRRGAPADRHRGRGRVPLPLGCRRRLRRPALRVGVARAARRRGQPEPVPGPGLQARRAHPSGRRRAREGRRAHARVPGDRDRARLHRAVAVAGRRDELPGPGRPPRAPPPDARLPRARVRADAGRAGTAGRVQAVRARLLRHRPGRLGQCAADVLEARRPGACAGRPRPSRAGREHRADRRVPRRREPPRRVPFQQPQVRRRRPDRRLGEPV